MDSRPNILVIMADDHGPWAYRRAGCAAAWTPAMDWLADTGCQFTQAFTPSPVCSPARASFFTGLLPSAHGIHDWIDERKYGEIAWLDPEATMPLLLQHAGYDTALVGKWHCGRSHVPQPGFDHWFSHGSGHQYPHFGAQRFSTKTGMVDAFGRQSRLLFDEARRWLRARTATKPFFLFYGPVDTHSPFTGHSRVLVNALRDLPKDDIPYEPEQTAASQRTLPFPGPGAEREEHLNQYLASVAFIDQQIEGLIETLEETAALENTLVVYLSDHGLMHGHHGLVGKGNGSIPQNFYDEAIRVPCIARWPAAIPADTRCHAPVDHLDWFTTLLAVAGKTSQDGAARPGRDLRPLWTQANADWRSDQYCEYGNARMVRTPVAKLVVRCPGRSGRTIADELYDLQSDPRECVNRVGDPTCAPAIAALRYQIGEYFARYSRPGKSGWDIGALPQYNAGEPWLN